MQFIRKFELAIVALLCLAISFVPASSFSNGPRAFVVPASTTSPTKLNFSPLDLAEPASASSSISVSIDGIDPAAAVGQAAGALITSPAILAVPILAGAGLATVIALLIAAYANPADPEE